jgi:hypothetical protein
MTIYIQAKEANLNDGFDWEHNTTGTTLRIPVSGRYHCSLTRHPPDICAALSQ